jgi:SAM-dependent methyltransferase
MTDVYREVFDPLAYLRTYYAGPLSDDERFNLSQLRQTLDRFRADGGRPGFRRALEVGCGPTIHHAIPLVPHVAELHLSDYLPANLAEVRRWLDRDPTAHDWSAYLRGVLAAEGENSSDDDVRQRADALRARVTALKECDLRQPHPLGEPAAYDLVTCFYTAECAARDRREWAQVMRHLGKLVAEGGVLFQVAMRRGAHYRVGGTDIPAVPVDERDFAAVLPECGFAPRAATITPARVADWADHGFEGVIVVTAEK